MLSLERQSCRSPAELTGRPAITATPTDSVNAMSDEDIRSRVEDLPATDALLEFRAATRPSSRLTWRQARRGPRRSPG
jgi:hypothetical protein